MTANHNPGLLHRNDLKKVGSLYPNLAGVPNRILDRTEYLRRSDIKVFRELRSNALHFNPRRKILMDKTGLSQTSLSDSLARLEKFGMITREVWMTNTEARQKKYKATKYHVNYLSFWRIPDQVEIVSKLYKSGQIVTQISAESSHLGLTRQGVLCFNPGIRQVCRRKKEVSVDEPLLTAGNVSYAGIPASNSKQRDLTDNKHGGFLETEEVAEKLTQENATDEIRLVLMQIAPSTNPRTQKQKTYRNAARSLARMLKNEIGLELTVALFQWAAKQQTWHYECRRNKRLLNLAFTVEWWVKQSHLPRFDAYRTAA